MSFESEIFVFACPLYRRDDDDWLVVNMDFCGLKSLLGSAADSLSLSHIVSWFCGDTCIHSFTRETDRFGNYLCIITIPRPIIWVWNLSLDAMWEVQITWWTAASKLVTHQPVELFFCVSKASLLLLLNYCQWRVLLSVDVLLLYCCVLTLLLAIRLISYFSSSLLSMNMLWLTWPQKKPVTKSYVLGSPCLKLNCRKKTMLLIMCNLLKMKTCPKNRALIWHFWKMPK